jgi:hypothetical protein
MKQLFCLVIALASLVGCAYNDYRDTTPTGVHQNDTTRTLAGQSTDVSTQMSASYYEDCMAKNRGFAGAQAECDNWIRAGRPGQMPQYQGWGFYPSYMGYSSRSGWVSPGY